MRGVVVDERVGCDLNATMIARPVFGGGDQLFPYSAPTITIGDVPAFDVADWLFGITTVRMRTKVDLDETDENSVGYLGDQDRDRERDYGRRLASEDEAEFLGVFLSRGLRP